MKHTKNKNSVKSLLSFYIVLIIISAILFSSCQTASKSNNNDNADANVQDNNGSNINGANEPVETTTNDPYAKFADNLGEYNFNGEEFKIQIYENINAHLFQTAEEENGELLNDAIYKRNRTLEDRFNVIITDVVFPDGSDQPRKIMTAGDSSAFDMVIPRCTDALTYWQNGYVYSMSKIPVIDISKPYWNNSVNPALTLGGDQYVALGDMIISNLDLTYLLVFNKTMIKDFSLEDPYGLVNSGQWTFDKMDEMMKNVINDINGDGVMDENDRYGLLSHPKMVLPNFWIAANVKSVDKDENDMPYLSMKEEKFINVFDKIFAITWDNNSWFKVNEPADVPSKNVELFTTGQALFMDCSFFYIESLRNMEADFGILPYPKYDESQTDYVSRLSYYNAIQVPVMNENLEKAGVMIEALNSESAKTVVPAYYEKALKTKFARDDESAQMLDLIFSHRIVDIGDTTLCDKIRDGFMAGLFEKNNRNLASKIESTEKTIQKFIDKIPQP